MPARPWFRAGRRRSSVYDAARTPRTVRGLRRSAAWRTGTWFGSAIRRAWGAGVRCGFSVSYQSDEAAGESVTALGLLAPRWGESSADVGRVLAHRPVGGPR